jgi:tRNA(Ile)-lysidine synthase
MKHHPPMKPYKNTSLFDAITAFVTQHRLIKPGMTIICGLSGGSDSLFLFHYLVPLHAAGTITLVAAHFDHEWRADSDNDVQLCNTVCQQYGIKLVVQKRSTFHTTFTYNGSKEELGRTMRRSFLQDVAKQYAADAIALGHHLQDQQETFFIRLARGSSLSGLTVMKPRAGLYIRPLLETHKNDIIHYLQQHAISFIEDSTNTSPDFLRNRVRHTVLPNLTLCDSRFDKNFLKTITRLQETEETLELFTKERFNMIQTSSEGAYGIQISLLLAQSTDMQGRLLLHWFIKEQLQFPLSHSFLQEVIRFLRHGKQQTHRLTKNWYLSKKNNVARIHSYAAANRSS